MTTPQRIAVVGRAGAGKTTVALRLGEALGLPVVHLDALFWQPDWTPVPRALFEERQAAAIAEDRWIIDGGYLTPPCWPQRARRADLIVVAEAPLLVCLWRVIRRSLRRSAGAPRPDRVAGGGEQLSPYFLWWIVRWGLRHPQLARTLAAEGHHVIVARDPEAAVRAVLARGH